MRRRPIPPYRQIRATSIVCEPEAGWELEVRGTSAMLEDDAPFPDWDASLAFALKRRFCFRETALSDLGISDPDAIQFQLVVRMMTAGKLSSSVPVQLDLNGRLFQPIDVRISPEAGKLTRDMTLETVIAVTGTAGIVDPLVPTLLGSRVWEDRWRVRLEGGRARLPFEIFDFEAAYLGLGMANALFHVEVADDAELDFEQAVCVSLNSRFATFIAAVERLDPVATAVLWDAVLRRVLVEGIGNGFDTGAHYPDASLGIQWTRWFGQAFPGESIDSVQRLLMEQPSRFEARIQSWSRIASRMNDGMAA